MPGTLLRLITSADLTLEPQTAAHADEMFVVLSDPAIYEYENAPPPSVDWLRSRYARLESRRSPDGLEQWLNWVIRQSAGDLIGYVQATVREGGTAAIAYVLTSACWGKGLASQATEAMINELAERYSVHALTAVLKQQNQRSMRMLQRLGFDLAPATQHLEHCVQPDEHLMYRCLHKAGSN